MDTKDFIGEVIHFLREDKNGLKIEDIDNLYFYFNDQIISPLITVNSLPPATGCIEIILDMNRKFLELFNLGNFEGKIEIKATSYLNLKSL